MNTQALIRRIPQLVLFGALSTSPAAALSLEEFAKFPESQQGPFISASVGMAAYIAAAQDDVPRARCIRRWYFGAGERVGEGVEAIANEITIAERIDPKKFHIEGIILGLLDRACAAAPAGQSSGPGATNR